MSAVLDLIRAHDTAFGLTVLTVAVVVVILLSLNERGE